MHTRSAPLVFLALLAACGGGSSSSPAPSPAPTNPFTITITAAGVAPKDLTVPQGTRVLFWNNDSKRHNMASDDHPDHQECPAINSIGVLNPGQSRETGNLNDIRTCGYHDHDNPTVTSLQGRLRIQ